MFQLSRRGHVPRCATNLELHRMTWTHIDYRLRLILWAEQGFVIAVTKDAGSWTPFQFHSRWHISVARQGDKRGATLHHITSTPSQIESLVCMWSDGCSMSIRIWTQTFVPWRDPGGLVRSLLPPFHLKVVKRLAGSLRALESPFSTRGNAHPFPAHRLPDSLSTSRWQTKLEMKNSSIKSMLSLGGMHKLSTNFRCWWKKKKCVTKCSN